MSRITHFKVQPKNIQYWDYYILCRLDTYAAVALQRFEYWDGTKSDGNIHSEDINDILESIEEEATQDTSRFFYKAQDELQWELMGLTGEKYTASLINFLIKDLSYLEQRNNPSNAMDRKKQYLFHDELVQDHINYLGYIIDYFKRLGFQLNPIYYAIEKLTEAKIHIDTLNIASVIEKLEEMHIQMEEDEAKVKESKKYKPILPKFIRIQLNRDKGLLPLLKVNKLRRFRNFAEWKAQFCGIDSAETRDANGNNADCTPQERGSNSNNYKQQLQTERENEGTPASTNPQQDDSSIHSSTQSFSANEKTLSSRESIHPSESSSSTSVSNGKTSESGVEHLSTIGDNPAQDVDNKQAVIQPDTSPIATATTSTQAPNARRDTEPLLSNDGERVRDYWSQLGFESTSASNSHWNTLSKHIASFEQMDSLYKYARAKLKNADDPTVHPGNMVKVVNGWKQKREPVPEQPKPTGKPSMRNAAAEHDRMVAEVQARIAAQRAQKQAEVAK